MYQGIGNSPIGLYEENYRLLMELAPELLDDNSLRFAGAGGLPDLSVRVVERGPYTTTLVLSREFGARDLLPDLRMTVRAYHDAQVAEVTGYQGCDRLPPPYAIGNTMRYQRDEKRQVNRLLYQILNYFSDCQNQREDAPLINP